MSYLPTPYLVYIYSLLFVFGAIIGSFINVVIYRVPKQSFLKEKRSYCPSCKTQIKSYDLIPVLSYLILGGKCRQCKQKISIRYPLVELFCGIMAVLSFLRFDFTYKTPLAFGVVVILVAIFMIDFATMEIPDGLTIAVIPFAIWAIFVFDNVTIMERIIGFFIISVPMLLLTLAVKSAFGGGDIKLIAVCGFLLGLQNVVFAMFVAILLGGSYAVYLLVTGKSKRGAHIAFGPYICIGVAVSMFYGAEIVSWYLMQFAFNG